MRTFDTYRRIGQRRVGGYTEPPFLSTLHVLDAEQRRAGIAGPIVEIGVHHGQLFIGMHLLQERGEKSVAIDLFGDQERNIDNSGRGDLNRFRANVERWATMSGVVIHEGDSTEIQPGDVAAMKGARLFSVDGGHIAETVESDMRLAERAVCPGGIVIADDVFNQGWPSVAVGTLEYMKTGTLVPFAIGQNKTLFTTDGSWATRYQQIVLEAYADKYTTAVFPDREFADHRVVCLLRVPRTPAHLLRRSEIARKAYHAVFDPLARRAQRR